MKIESKSPIQELTHSNPIEQFYIYIPEGKIGRLIENKESPEIIGLCTNDFTTCNIIVLISKDKKRIVLIHMDGTLNIHQVIADQKEWIGEGAEFFNYHRNRVMGNQTSRRLADKLSVYNPIEIIVDDTIQAITITLNHVQPCPQVELPSNTISHNDQALIFMQHRIEPISDLAPNYLTPLLFDGSKWSTYESFLTPSINIKQLAIITAINDIDDNMLLFACILGYQFLMAYSKTEKSFLLGNLATCFPLHAIGDIADLILLERKRFPRGKSGFAEFFTFVMDKAIETYKYSEVSIKSLQIILYACYIIFERFPITDSEAKKISVRPSPGVTFSITYSADFLAKILLLRDNFNESKRIDPPAHALTHSISSMEAAVFYPIRVGKPHLLWERIGKGYLLSRMLKDFLPSINFAQFFNGELFKPKEPVPQLDLTLESKLAFSPIKLLDIIFFETLKMNFPHYAGNENPEDVKKIPERIMENSPLDKGPNEELVHLFVIGFACYQLNLCRDINILMVYKNIYFSRKGFLNFGIYYGEKQIVNHFLEKTKKADLADVIRSNRERDGFYDKELMRFLEKDEFQRRDTSTTALIHSSAGMLKSASSGSITTSQPLSSRRPTA